MVAGNSERGGQLERREGNRRRGLCFICALAAAQGSMMLARGSDAWQPTGREGERERVHLPAG
jgi:hypothetical protein